MARYFTSDLHLGSSLINRYGSRPFSDADDAVKKLMRRICDACGRNDLLVHVGDFMLGGTDRHGAEEDVGLARSLSDYLAGFPCRLLLVEGNHDRSNCTTDAKSLTVDLGRRWKNVHVCHFPSDHPEYPGPKSDSESAFFVNLCGHVHERWLARWDEKSHVLNVNVGVDVWGYRPVCDCEIIGLLDFLWDVSFQFIGTMTRRQYEELKTKRRLDKKTARSERLAAMGIGEEECRRRKSEAMRNKGIAQGKGEAWK